MERTTVPYMVYTDEQGELQGWNAIKINRQQIVGLIEALVSSLQIADLDHTILLLEDEKNRSKYED